MRMKKSNHEAAVGKSIKRKITHASPSIRLPKKLTKTPKISGNPENSLPEVETSFANLENGSLAEVIADPSHANRTVFAICNRGRIRLVVRLEDRGRILVPTPRSTVDFYGVNLPNGVALYKSVRRLLHSLLEYIRCAVDVSDEYAIVLPQPSSSTPGSLTACLNAVVLSVIGLPQSGKSTLLELMSSLCRRGLLASDVSQAAAYQASSNLNPTLLIDEIDWNSSRGASNLRQLYRAGSNPSSRSLASSGYS